MDISTKAKERFCKDCNIPLKLFQEPYFTDRLKLYDKFYGTLGKWEVFIRELERYYCEQDYFEEYNCVKDVAILNIKESEAYKRFNEEDMNKFSVQNVNFSNKDIFKPSNDGKTFISVDMRKANFSSLHHYSEDMFKDTFGVANTWEEYINKFTNNQHIVNSKYIRQVILGNCNPKRHITYEKYLMNTVLTYLTSNYVSMDRVVCFSNDEIVVDISDMKDSEKKLIRFQIALGVQDFSIPLKVDLFKLHKIYGTDGYYKEICNSDVNVSIEFKCLDNYILPFVLRKFSREEIIDSDKVFYFGGLLSKFIEIPRIEVMFNEK